MNLGESGYRETRGTHTEGKIGREEAGLKVEANFVAQAQSTI